MRRGVNDRTCLRLRKRRQRQRGHESGLDVLQCSESNTNLVCVTGRIGERTRENENQTWTVESDLCGSLYLINGLPSVFDFSSISSSPIQKEKNKDTWLPIPLGLLFLCYKGLRFKDNTIAATYRRITLFYFHLDPPSLASCSTTQKTSTHG
jgi:hypothetical protein